MTSKRRDILGHPGVDPLDRRAARLAALDVLARRDHAAVELRRKLLGKGYDAAVVGGIVEQLCAEKLLDDRRYVENFVAYHAARGHGPVRVREELRKLGLAGAVVEEGVLAYSDWSVALHRARQKKFGAPPPTDTADRQRQSRFLSYRGFTGAQIGLALGFDTDSDVDTQNL